MTLAPAYCLNQSWFHLKLSQVSQASLVAGLGGKVALAFCLLAGDAGALLVSDSQTLFYYQVNNACVLRLDDLTQSHKELHTFPATIIGVFVFIGVY